MIIYIYIYIHMRVYYTHVGVCCERLLLLCARVRTLTLVRANYSHPHSTPVWCALCVGGTARGGVLLLYRPQSLKRASEHARVQTRVPMSLSFSCVARVLRIVCAPRKGKKEVVWRRRRVLMPPDAYCVRTGSLFSLFFFSSSSFPCLPTCVGRVGEEVCVFGGRRCSGEIW
ncbi:unnamed protein product [Trypanosoma congolense IL3000]|uniref:WGS project CAEQ00000000 data, annotated contig 1125 n=1 Tax=Trypanosoma congolense (strain IL3000) TaxID=1068625 RepID=F9W3X7_TRYCI|nr:unnamed protein product [Trypanosoma congolense IL3000]